MEKIKNLKGFSGSTLKIIAMIAMLIDHFGAVILYPMIIEGLNQGNLAKEIYITYIILRKIGRIAFPIYCFLLVEGFYHTSNKFKYAGRLLLFSIISEIPFDLSITKYSSQTILPFPNNLLTLKDYFTSQNVFFTLFLGFILIWFIDYFRKTLDKNYQKIIMYIIGFIFVFGLEYFIHCDYGYFGIFVIFFLYLVHESKLKTCILGSLCFAWEYTAPLAFIPIYFYNGKRGLNIKYFFYLFYPMHLLLLFFIKYMFF